MCVCVRSRACVARTSRVRACRVRILTSVLARRRIVCVRGRRVCAFTSVRCIDVSCACAVTSLVRAQPSCVCVHERACAAVVCARSRACACSRRVCAFTSVRARRRILCVCAVCVLSRALWTFGPFPAGDVYSQLATMVWYGPLTSVSNNASGVIGDV